MKASHLAVYFSEATFSQLIMDKHVLKHMCRGEVVAGKSVGISEDLGCRHVIISSNERILCHKSPRTGSKLAATTISRKGKWSTTRETDRAHEDAIRKRIIEAHVVEK